MRAMRAEQFNGYEELKLINLPKPAVTDGKVLVRITAAGVTPLDHTILSGKFHGSKAPLTAMAALTRSPRWWHSSPDRKRLTSPART
jgi:NADPH:quinone reductase-like Zn-dependent oxidoreductase